MIRIIAAIVFIALATSAFAQDVKPHKLTVQQASNMFAALSSISQPQGPERKLYKLSVPTMLALARDLAVLNAILAPVQVTLQSIRNEAVVAAGGADALKGTAREAKLAQDVQKVMESPAYLNDKGVELVPIKIDDLNLKDNAISPNDIAQILPLIDDGAK